MAKTRTGERTRAAELLRAWCETQGWGSIARLAEHCGVSRPTAGGWTLGETVPGDVQRFVIDAYTDGAVPWWEWWTDEQRAEFKARFGRTWRGEWKR